MSWGKFGELCVSLSVIIVPALYVVIGSLRDRRKERLGLKRPYHWSDEI